jgi:hypothetical protein
MDERMQDVYNEWLLRYGFRTIAFSEVYDNGMSIWGERLRIQNALIVVFNNEQGTHNYTLQKLTKE